MERTGWKLRCKDHSCRRWFTFGLALHSLAQLQSSGKRYLPPSDLTFPAVPMDYWQSGDPVNRLALDPEDHPVEEDNAREG